MTNKIRVIILVSSIVTLALGFVIFTLGKDYQAFRKQTINNTNDIKVIVDFLNKAVAAQQPQQ